MRQKHSSAAVAFQTEFVQGISVKEKAMVRNQESAKGPLSAVNEE
jgi:hypothetical protein